MRCFVTGVSNIKKHLPFDIPILKETCVLHPERRFDLYALTDISRLTLNIGQVLHMPRLDVLHTVFQTDPSTTPEDLLDLERKQWKFYQTEQIPQEMYLEKISAQLLEVTLEYKTHIGSKFMSSLALDFRKTVPLNIK